MFGLLKCAGAVMVDGTERRLEFCVGVWMMTTCNLLSVRWRQYCGLSIGVDSTKKVCVNRPAKVKSAVGKTSIRQHIVN